MRKRRLPCRTCRRQCMRITEIIRIMAATPITAVPVTTRDYRLESALVAATGGPLGMEATVITVTAAGIIQGMVTGGVDIAATVMGGVGTLVMAEAILAHIVEVLMPPAVDSRDTAEEVPSLVVVVGAEAAGIVRELVQEFRFQSQNHPRPRSMGVLRPFRKPGFRHIR